MSPLGGRFEALLAAVACLAIAVVMLLMSLGCTQHVGVRYDPWLPAYDKPWGEAVSCWQRELGTTKMPKRPNIIVRDDCMTDPKSKTQYFYFLNDESQYVTGTVTGATVQICPDAKALGHEFSHWVSRELRGTYGYNGERKCGL